jgi:hypothetical protein
VWRSVSTPAQAERRARRRSGAPAARSPARSTTAWADRCRDAGHAPRHRDAAPDSTARAFAPPSRRQGRTHLYRSGALS